MAFSLKKKNCLNRSREVTHAKSVCIFIAKKFLQEKIN